VIIQEYVNVKNKIMKFNKLKQVIIQEIQRLKEQKISKAPISQMGMTGTSAGGDTFPGSSPQMNSTLFAALGSPQTTEEAIAGYQRLYQRDNKKVKGKLPSPEYISKLIMDNFGPGGTVTPSSLPILLNPWVWRAGWFVLGLVGAAITEKKK
tara:strand:- start:71 stop:526 length:456 start_codon:yes stop_codon:yes gene_type:complete